MVMSSFSTNTMAFFFLLCLYVCTVHVMMGEGGGPVSLSSFSL